MEYWGLTDTGNVRKQNQDFFVMQPLGANALLVLVCDGMGGAKSGNVASKLAAEVFTEEIKRTVKPEMCPDKAEAALIAAVSLANTAVFENSKLGKELNGMGTTLVAALVLGKSAVITNVGDSRAYLLGNNGVRCITTDHSVVEMMVQRGELTREQAKTYPGKNLITRAIGTEKSVLCDTYKIPLAIGDFLLLCSDGLSNLLADQELLFEIVHGVNKSDCCERLFDIARQRGAPDNMTAVLVSV